jgi:hypothetical protein
VSGDRKGEREADKVASVLLEYTEIDENLFRIYFN